MLLVDYLERGNTINAQRYCEVLKKLRSAIKRKRPHLLSKGVLLMHDNARPHSARQTQDLLGQFNWDIFPHPPYSPDLAPSDFHLFPKLKGHLGGKHFRDDEELKAEVNNYLRKVGTQHYQDGIQKLVPRFQKCIERNGDYVENRKQTVESEKNIKN